MFDISDASNIDREKWSEFANAHAHGTVFHTPYMYDTWDSAINHESFAYFAINEDKQISALLVGFYQTVKPVILAGLSRRAVMLQAPIYNDPEALKVLLTHYLQKTPSKAVYTEIRNHYLDADYRQICESLDFTWEGHYNIIKPIPSSCEALWKETGRKRKDGINKARKSNFEIFAVTSLQAVENFYPLLRQKYSDLKLPIPDKGFFENCLRNDVLSSCKFFELSENGNVRISLLAFLYKKTLHALFIGIDQDPDFIRKRPVDFFYHEVMRWCIENEVRYFDWMGAGRPGVPYGVRDFKLQYGGDLIDFGRFVKVHKPLMMFIAKAGFRAMQKMKGTA